MSEWLPAVWPLLSNPGFYGPVGVVASLILYGEVSRYRARSGRLEYTLYVAIREEDNLFWSCRFPRFQTRRRIEDRHAHGPARRGGVGRLRGSRLPR